MAKAKDARTIFDQITESPEELAAFLAKLNAVDTPWEARQPSHGRDVVRVAAAHPQDRDYPVHTTGETEIIERSFPYA